MRLSSIRHHAPTDGGKFAYLFTWLKRPLAVVAVEIRGCILGGERDFGQLKSTRVRFLVGERNADNILELGGWMQKGLKMRKGFSISQERVKVDKGGEMMMLLRSI